MDSWLRRYIHFRDILWRLVIAGIKKFPSMQLIMLNQDKTILYNSDYAFLMYGVDLTMCADDDEQLHVLQKLAMSMVKKICYTDIYTKVAEEATIDIIGGNVGDYKMTLKFYVEKKISKILPIGYNETKMGIGVAIFFLIFATVLSIILVSSGVDIKFLSISSRE